MIFKTLLRDWVRSHGWDLVKGPNLIDFLRSRDVDCVFDVGANRGEYGEQLYRWGYRGNVVSFEPEFQAFQMLDKLRRNARFAGRWQAVNIGLGDRHADLHLNVSANSRFSSVLGQTDAAKTFDPNMRIIRSDPIKVAPLDSLIGRWPGKRIYLKIDTQGFEQTILNGAGSFLKDCVGVQLELPVEHLYEETWRFEDAVSYMRERGFVPAQMVPVTAITTDPASVTEFDCTFRRG